MREWRVVHQSGHGCPGRGFASTFRVCWRRRSRLAACAFALLFFPFAAFIPSAHADTVDYVYDELGRLTGVVDSSGASARYVYDALGNVTSIERNAAGTVSILEFTPNHGLVGETVTVSGSGFSANPANNSITVNGVAAAVTSATATRLVFTVPAGATTGRIAVTTTAGTATSSSDFVVMTAMVGVPTITGFTPDSGTSGTAVTITGTNFETPPGGTRVSFNQSIAAITSATSTTLTVSVPARTLSGRIRVQTQGGVATSGDDFVIPPSGINAADIADRKRIATDGTPQTNTVVTSGKSGLFLFDGNRGDYLSLDITALTVIPAFNGFVRVYLYAPNGTMVATGAIGDSTSKAIHFPALPASGTYSIYFGPSAAETWSLTAALNKDPVIVIDGASVQRTHTFSRQTTRTIFIATAGQSLGLGFYDLMFTPSSSSLGIAVKAPSGAAINSGSACYSSNGGCNYDLSNLAESGEYSIVVTPAAGATGSYTATLSNDLTGVLTVGAPKDIALVRRGQNARLVFDGAAGQSVGLEVAGFVTTPPGKTAVVWVYKPDGLALTNSTTNSASSGVFFNMPSLPATGLYTVFVNPNVLSSASMQLTVEPGAPLVPDGDSADTSLTVAGETARFTFDGTAGQNLGLGIRPLVLSPSTSTYATTKVFKPDGSLLVSSLCYVSYGGCTLRMTSLPVVGTYSVTVAPQYGGTGNLTTTLSSDVTGALVPGTPFSVDIARNGQGARLTFYGTAGTSRTLTFAPIATAPSGGYVRTTVFGPDGTTHSTAGFYTSGTMNLSLPVTGTYTVLIDPIYAHTATMNVTVSP